MRPSSWLVALTALTFFGHPPAFATAELIRVAVRADSPPFSQLKLTDAPTDISSYSGYVVDICKRVLAEHLEDEVVVVPVYAGDERFEAIKQGRADLHCGPVSATSSRLGEFVVSQPVFLSGTTYSLGATNGAPLGRPLRIGFLRNTTALRGVEELELREHFGSHRKSVFDEISVALNSPETVVDFEHLRWFYSHKLGLKALCSGDIDYYVGDIDILTYHSELINKGEECEILVARRTITREIYVLLFSASAFEQRPVVMTRLIKAFQVGIHELFQNGSIELIFEENFRGKMPSRELQSFFESFSRIVRSD